MQPIRCSIKVLAGVTAAAAVLVVALGVSARPESAAKGATEQITRQRIEFQYWPQARVQGVRILFAIDPRLSEQGFAGAPEKEFDHTLIIFPAVAPGMIFTNGNYGFGSVKRDVKVIYLDREWKVLRQDVMKKRTGESVPPEGTAMAIEGLPEAAPAAAR